MDFNEFISRAKARFGEDLGNRKVYRKKPEGRTDFDYQLVIPQHVASVELEGWQLMPQAPAEAIKAEAVAPQAPAVQETLPVGRPSSK
jgi:hypothetical protein